MALGNSTIWNMLLTKNILLPNVLSGLNFFFKYLEKILIYSTPWEDCLQYMEIVGNCLKAAQLKIKLSKCQLFQTTLTLSKQVIESLPEKVIAITDLKKL